MKSSFEYTSRFTGEPCVCIVTGVGSSRSNNRKTGAMAQVWFLLRDRPPHEGVALGADAGVCGTCPLRAGKGCYVRTEQAPLSIWKKYHRGGYREDLPEKLPATRLGAYGDPASVPAHLWKKFFAVLPCSMWTGYTHGWRTAPWLRNCCMASVESAADARRALEEGWSVFETIRADTSGPIEPWAEMCAAVSRGVQCRQCLKCSGHCPTQRWIQIPAHGARKKLVHGE